MGTLMLLVIHAAALHERVTSRLEQALWLRGCRLVLALCGRGVAGSVRAGLLDALSQARTP